MASIASKLVEMAEKMEIDVSNCQSGNIKTVLDAITIGRDGEVLNSGVIATRGANGPFISRDRSSQSYADGYSRGYAEGRSQAMNDTPPYDFRVRY